MDRRTFSRSILTGLASVAGGFMLLVPPSEARVYMTPGEAAKLFWGNQKLIPISLKLSRQQRKDIKEASGVAVRASKMAVWKTESGGWFVLDSVIGKHEYIDYAVALSDKGSVKAIEILVYREGYGDAVVNPRWRAQFYDKDPSRQLTHGKEIMNISGATLSCRHITDGINRLTTMWELVFSKV